MTCAHRALFASLGKVWANGRLRAGVIFVIAGPTLALTLQWMGAFKPVEGITYDHRMQVARGEASLDKRIAVILIDEAAIEAMEPLVGRWPWPRSVHAEILNFLNRGDPRAIAMDILFTERQGRSGEGLGEADRALVKAVARSEQVHQAMQLYHDPGATSRDPLPPEFRKRFGLPAGEGVGRTGLNQASLPFPDLWQASAGVGSVSLAPDPDGVYRSLQPGERYGGQFFPLLGLSPLVNRQDPQALQRDGGYLHRGEQRIPVDSQGRILANLHGDYRAYSMSGVLASIQAMNRGQVAEMSIRPGEFEDKIVMVGGSAAGLKDLKATPLSPKAPGTFLHASLASNFLTGDFLVPPRQSFTIAAALLLSLTAAIILLKSQRWLFQLATPLGIILAYGGAGYWAFVQGWVLHLTTPLLSVLFTAGGLISYLSFTEGRERRRVRRMLGQYVSPAVLEQVLERYGEMAEAEVGTSEEMTLLFSDVRGFTGISESLSPARVVELLNAHLSTMNDVLFEHGGTLDKFIGDAIMAYWGAPLPDAEHPTHALNGARGMVRALEPLNTHLSGQGLPPVSIGVGLNTGTMILGNIGSEKKLDFTVIGDAVNLAARLEGLTKQYGRSIILSQFTYQGLHGEDQTLCAPLDLVRVKGRGEPVRLYTPLFPEWGEDQTLAPRAERALAAYLSRQWDTALAEYETLRETALAETAEQFLARCHAYRQNPPPEDWDGVFEHETK